MREQDWWEDAVQTMQMEKAAFFSAFIIRKLMEAHQLSMQAEATKIAVDSFAPRRDGVAPDATRWDDIAKYYDLGGGAERSVPVRDLVNWIIHSFTFVVECRSDLAGGLWPTAFYCNSDRTRWKDLIRVDWRRYRALLAAIASDDVVSIQRVRDGRGELRELRSDRPFTAKERQEFFEQHADLILDATEEFEA